MPGLLRGVARTAAIAGTASAVSGRVQRRQAQRWQAQGAVEVSPPPPPAPAPASPAPVAAAPGGPSTIDQLKELAELKNQGILTDAEFAAEKAKILG